VNLLGLIPSLCIYWKSCIALSGCSCFIHLGSFFFPIQKCSIALCLVPCGHLWCHSWWVPLVLKPECFLCLLMFEMPVPFICRQLDIQKIKLIRHVFSTSEA
jgi:hypothetical protein